MSFHTVIPEITATTFCAGYVIALGLAVLGDASMADAFTLSASAVANTDMVFALNAL